MRHGFKSDPGDPLPGAGVIAWTFLGIIAALLVGAFLLGRWSASW